MALPGSSASGCPTTARSRWASARATSAMMQPSARQHPLDIVKADWGGARALGLPITLHTSGPSPIKRLNDAGLLGPDVQLVHPLLTTAEERQILKERGTSYSTSPVGESRRPASAGVIQLAELLDAGVKVSMSIDHTGSFNCDFFEGMRILYNLHQHRVGQRVPLTTKRLVQLARWTARSILASPTDRLADSWQAGRHHPGAHERHQHGTGGRPYEALVSFAQPRNVDTVIADGRILWRAGRFTALDHAEVLKEAAESAAALRARANWT